ncbi:hypothetical protein BO70DRAFT_78100 [Aspergillus heteromorphus CBS 117.55]|uniref:Uncharacterized protein n=1 Tax=Aspergillus heteromorphus CBS 117.55 TaxID=1448321 RepID=A0A317X1E2_9EURO|nr:uncharacterized protein BO70DRAFT_78100 [Aspergillus heteromorphus CBS 117.55]PWY90778.1 hypothetical protein BO70DRAFT_78100 [Aspergillus heteromorphus CBS 117.55]
MYLLPLRPLTGPARSPSDVPKKPPRLVKIRPWGTEVPFPTRSCPTACRSIPLPLPCSGSAHAIEFIIINSNVSPVTMANHHTACPQ